MRIKFFQMLVVRFIRVLSNLFNHRVCNCCHRSNRRALNKSATHLLIIQSMSQVVMPKCQMYLSHLVYPIAKLDCSHIVHFQGCITRCSIQQFSHAIILVSIVQNTHSSIHCLTLLRIYHAFSHQRPSLSGRATLSTAQLS